MQKLVKLPGKFFDDHRERALPTPAVVRETDRSVWVNCADPALAELLDDARYYSHAYGPDLCSRGLIASAKATVRAIEATCAQPSGTQS
jgi:hypothetical protein